MVQTGSLGLTGLAMPVTIAETQGGVRGDVDSGNTPKRLLECLDDMACMPMLWTDPQDIHTHAGYFLNLWQ